MWNTKAEDKDIVVRDRLGYEIRQVCETCHFYMGKGSWQILLAVAPTVSCHRYGYCNSYQEKD
jgi:hypothetical protein